MKKFSYQETIDKIGQELPETEAMWKGSEIRRQMAKALAHVRKQAGLTQKNVSERTGWDKAFVSRLESAFGVMPDTLTVSRFAEACGVKAGLVLYTEQLKGRVHILGAVELGRKIQGEPISRFESLQDKDCIVEVAIAAQAAEG